MSEELKKVTGNAEAGMKKAINHLEIEISKIRAGKASPSILEGINVDYYGTPTPISQVGNVQVLDSRTLSIQPWEKNMLALIERAIMAANIGITPQNDGVQIRLFTPPLTEERRRDLVKKAKGEGEHAKIGIRNNRKDAMDMIKDLKSEGLSEDLAKDSEDQIQQITNGFIKKIDELLEVKEKDIMTV